MRARGSRACEDGASPARITSVRRHTGYLAPMARTARTGTPHLGVDGRVLDDRYHGIGEPARASLRVDLGFLPAPVDLATAAKFRLNEYTLHSWDVRVAFDPAAVLQPAAVPLLLDLVAPMVGWLARPAPLEGRSVTVRVDLRDPERSLVLTLGEQTSIAAVPADAAPAKVDGVLALPAEAWLRLVAGRLKPPYTPCGAVAATGVSLDTLRAVFAGY